MTQSTFLHQREEHGHENQHVNRRGNHAAHQGRGDRLHHVRADSGFPQDGNQTGQDDAHSHEFWTEPVDGALDNGLLDVFVANRFSARESPVQRFVKINDHDHAGLDCDTEQRDVADHTATLKL